VTPPRGGSGFGRSALRWENKIFAMLVRGRLVVKLPAARVEALDSSGGGVRFDANKGTPMREWLSLDPESGASLAAAGPRGARLRPGRTLALGQGLVIDPVYDPVGPTPCTEPVVQRREEAFPDTVWLR